MIQDLHALVPDEHGGVSIVSVIELAGRLADEHPEDAVLNAGIDSFSRPSGDELLTQVERVRRLNLTGDTTAFWAATE